MPSFPTSQAPLLTRSLGMALLGAMALTPAAVQAAAGPPAAGPGRCGGTLLQLQVEERGSAAFDRFRFDLGLEAEAASKDEAMALLSQRLAALRTALRPLVRGELTIPAPSTYRSGGGTGAGATPWRDHAGTSVSGVVGTVSYDTLIQTAARLPGVTLRTFRAEATAGSEIELRTRLLRKALAEGRRQAEVTAAALGLSRLRLLRIDQRGAAPVRPMPYALAEARTFTPEEAPAPEQSLGLALDYCLF